MAKSCIKLNTCFSFLYTAQNLGNFTTDTNKGIDESVIHCVDNTLSDVPTKPRWHSENSNQVLVQNADPNFASDIPSDVPSAVLKESEYLAKTDGLLHLVGKINF